ncbi:LPXTG cell wall anchor domain-containing protein [Staphylococcus xylosus]
MPNTGTREERNNLFAALFSGLGMVLLFMKSRRKKEDKNHL